MNLWVQAIRSDKLVGLGSCSPIDECYDDAELVQEFARWEITTKRDALAWARRTHRMWADRLDEMKGEF